MARSIAHWSPRYVVGRARDLVYRRLHPGVPWLHPAANAFLERHLRPDHRGFEWGAGASTVWLAARCGFLTSVEYQRGWCERVAADLRARGLGGKVDLRLYEYRPETKLPAAYVDAILEAPDAGLDFVLVDGRKRDRCALLAIPKLRPGGWLIVDNVERYLPPPAPRAPLSRRPEEGPATPLWREFAARVETWPREWFSSGVTDTAIWTKPAG